MSVRHLAVAVGLTVVVAVLVAVPVAASNAATPNDVYVETPANGGDDANFPTCSQVAPCATVPAAIFAADATGTTIHVGPGTFDGELRPGALSKSVTIVGSGSGSGGTKLTADSSGDGFVLEVGSGITALSELSIEGGLFVDVLVDGTGVVTGDHVVLGQSGCNLLVEGGSATLTDSTVQDGGQGCPSIEIPAAEISLTGGSASLLRTRVLNAVPGSDGVSVSGGATFTADQSFFDDSAQDRETNDSPGVRVTAGTATITRSVFRGWGYSGVNTNGGTAEVLDSTFQNNVVGAGEDSGSLTVVRSTFEHEAASLAGSVSIAGSVLGSKVTGPDFGIEECVANSGAPTDLGYNLSSDQSCGFTGTSQDNVTDLHLDTQLADRGGPVGLLTVATFWPSRAVDLIPAGATYGVSSTPLCTGTDLRAVPRPQGGACDAGSMELVATTMTVAGPATAKPHTDVTFDANVEVPDVGVLGIEAPAHGTVTFTSGATTLCADVITDQGQASCTTSALGAGAYTVRATFTPVVPDASTLHSSTVTRTIKVGTTPAFTSKAKITFVVGKSQTFRVRASGSPSPRITLVKGKVPAGLTFKAGTGSATISGKAKASGVGSHSVTVQATNLRGSVRQVIKVVVSRH